MMADKEERSIIGLFHIFEEALKLFASTATSPRTATFPNGTMREADAMLTTETTVPLGNNSIRTEIVKTDAQLRHAYAIRAICFMEENGVLAAQAFDGNDLQATHIIVYAGDEPIGSQRIRWFKDFAKIERSAFRKAWRHPRNLKQVADVVFAHIARKGYTQVLTHAQPVYARLWRSVLGFKIVEGKAPVYFDGHDEPYLELVKVLEPPFDAITAQTSPAVMFRVEGEWDHASTFEAKI